MGLLSRYYTKQSAQRRMMEERNVEAEIMEDNVVGLYREISHIQEHLLVYEDKPAVAQSGFFGL